MTSRLVRSEQGFTLIEVLAAVTVLVIGAMSAITLIERANSFTQDTASREAATSLAREVTESARGIPFSRLAGGALDGLIQNGEPGMADAAPAPGWQIRRRNVTYTVTTSVCSMDDARDGAGIRDAGSFCTDSAPLTARDPATGAVDRSPEDYKRVRVNVAWTNRGVPRAVHQTAIVNNPGSAGGPAVRTLDLVVQPPGTWITTSTDLDFNVTTSSAPHTLHWLVDGASKGPVTSGSGLAWSFRWPLGAIDDPAGVGDGTYLVSAEAFDRYGVAGASRSLTVTVNRSLPDPVQAVSGGRSPDPRNPELEIVDLEWLAVSERDIIGYEVERVELDGTTTLICPRQAETECQDLEPPDRPAVTYRVWSLDYASPGVERRSTTAAELVVTEENQPPNPPTDLTITKSPTGEAILRWEAPVPADHDAGDGVDFYRVYRDGRNVASRYARWDDDSQSVTFVDSATDDERHTYWISAVDMHYAESPLIGPVTG